MLEKPEEYLHSLLRVWSKLEVIYEKGFCQPNLDIVDIDGILIDIFNVYLSDIGGTYFDGNRYIM